MTLKTQIAADLPTFFNTEEYAETITYNGAEIPGIFIREDSETGNADAEHGRLYVSLSDVPAPDYRDTVIIDGQSWRVFRDQRRTNPESGDGYTWKIRLILAERPSIP